MTNIMYKNFFELKYNKEEELEGLGWVWMIMKKVILLLLTLIIGHYACASEYPGDLQFMPEHGKYVKDSNFRKVRRPLKEFKIGKKYCLRGTKNWDEQCQDAAMKYAFGDNWQELKDVIVKLIKAINEDDIDGIANLFTDRSNINISVPKSKEGKLNLVRSHMRCIVPLKGMTYLDILIKEGPLGHSYTVLLRGTVIYFNFKCDKASNCVKLPEIVIMNTEDSLAHHGYR